MTNKLLNDEISQQVSELFKELEDTVQIYFFTQENGCETCQDTQQLVEEVAGLSDKIQVSVHNLDKESEVAKRYKIDKTPSMVIAAQKDGEIVDYGVRLAGIPSGHEFASFIHGLKLVSSGDSGLAAETRTFLKELNSPIQMQVFVTPSCPYCPQSVILAHQMAMESPYVVAEMVEAMEFPELAERFNVSGVPQTTINQGAGTLIGAVPESELLEEIKAVLKEEQEAVAQ